MLNGFDQNNATVQDRNNATVQEFSFDFFVNNLGSHTFIFGFNKKLRSQD